MIQLERIGVPDLLGVLNALNAYAAELAAVHATKADVASMRESLDVISKTSDPEEIAEALTRFLSVLSESGGNPLLAALCRFLARIQIGLARQSSGQSLESWRKTTTKLTKARKGLVDAIEARDRDAARAAARIYGEQSRDVITASPSVKTALMGAPAMAELLASLLEHKAT
jgi:GntR family transcriptional repressor for pyruvate dehydrogenase complex